MSKFTQRFHARAFSFVAPLSYPQGTGFRQKPGRTFYNPNFSFYGSPADTFRLQDEASARAGIQRQSSHLMAKAEIAKDRTPPRPDLSQMAEGHLRAIGVPGRDVEEGF